jgi:hypothetical protein
MRRALIGIGALAILLVGAVGYGLFLYNRGFPPVSSEVVQLTAAKRAVLTRLKAEKKFGPDDYPPLGYTGIATPEDGAVATAAVNAIIDAVLARPDGPLPARVVSELIGKAVRKIGLLETEDRDRATGYMVEIWYILGFKGATGHFAYGSAFPIPPGYGEPLPPGWTAPDKPRPIA